MITPHPTIQALQKPTGHTSGRTHGIWRQGRPTWLLAAMPLILNMILSGCSGSPPQTTLEELTANQRQFNGRNVLVQGIVRTFDPPRHYWLENEALDRVALQGSHDLERWVGEPMQVQGIFYYDRTKGRRIAVESLQWLAPDQSH